uniref:Amidinotransferase n=1 Tax=Rhabditophanes sp. KR3021 TaxID=114890 RepID=A0AC35U4V0_9BILA
MSAKAVSDVIQKVLMVPPTFFCVEYAINPWMGGVVDKDKAMTQWTHLKNEIEAEGVEVKVLEHVNGLPDMVFSCNAGLAYNNKLYVSRFRHKERTGEEPLFLNWFKENGYEILGSKYEDYFEGGGDVFFTDYKTLWAGSGQRTDKVVIPKLSQLGKGEFEIIPMEMIHPNFYHLDTCMAPFSATGCLWYPPAFSQASQEEIRKRLPDSIAVDEDEATSFVCNAICFRKTVLSPIGMKINTREALKKLGYGVKDIDMSEFMKSGGACQCLVLKL